MKNDHPWRYSLFVMNTTFWLIHSTTFFGWLIYKEIEIIFFTEQNCKQKMVLTDLVHLRNVRHRRWNIVITTTQRTSWIVQINIEILITLKKIIENGFRPSFVGSQY